MDMNANSVATADREETMFVRYVFPNSIAYFQASWRASAQGNIRSVYRTEQLAFNIFDHDWVDDRLEEHVANARSALEWMSRVLPIDSETEPGFEEIRAFPGTEKKYEIPNPDDSVETFQLLDQDGEILFIIERSLKDRFRKPKGTISVGLHLAAFPGEANPVYKYTFLSREIDACNSLITQEIFPPRGTTIETLQRRDSHQKSYQWKTSAGWQITVAPGSHIYITNAEAPSL